VEKNVLSVRSHGSNVKGAAEVVPRSSQPKTKGGQSKKRKKYVWSGISEETERRPRENWGVKRAATMEKC